MLNPVKLVEHPDIPTGLNSVTTLPGLLQWRVGKTPADEAYRRFDPQTACWQSYSLSFLNWRGSLSEVSAPVARRLIKADVGAKAIAQVKATAKEMLERHLPSEQAEAVAQKLSTGTWTHDYPLFAASAKELGLPVSTAMLGDVLDLLKLYPQPTRMQDGGVEYLPIRRRRDVSKGMA